MSKILTTISVFIILNLTLLINPSYSKLYKWIDEEDQDHYANELYVVPKEYQNKVTIVESIQSEHEQANKKFIEERIQKLKQQQLQEEQLKSQKKLEIQLKKQREENKKFLDTFLNDIKEMLAKFFAGMIGIILTIFIGKLAINLLIDKIKKKKFKGK